MSRRFTGEESPNIIHSPSIPILISFVIPYLSLKKFSPTSVFLWQVDTVASFSARVAVEIMWVHCPIRQFCNNTKDQHHQMDRLNEFFDISCSIHKN